MSQRPIAYIELLADDLVYATSARTVEQTLECGEGIIQVVADLAARQVTLAVWPERIRRDVWSRPLAHLGVHVVESHSPDTWLEFTIRGSVLTVFAFTLAVGAFKHSGIVAPAPELPSLFLLALLEALALFGAGYPFYRRALAALAQGSFDTGVLIALAGLILFVAGGSLALSGHTSVARWSAWVLLIMASALTAGWFLIRGCTVWGLPHFRRRAKWDPCLL